MKEVSADGGRFERGGVLLGVDLDDADKGVITGGHGTMPDYVAGRGLYDGCLEGGDGLFAETCEHGVSEGGGTQRRAVGDELEEGIVKVSEGELLFGNVCWVPEVECRTGALFGVYEYEKEKPTERICWLKRDALRSKHCSLEEMAF